MNTQVYHHGPKCTCDLCLMLKLHMPVQRPATEFLVRVLTIMAVVGAVVGVVALVWPK